MSRKYYAGNKPHVKKQLDLQPDCEMVRFVMKSGAYLDLQLDTIEEVVDEFAGAQRICICGCTSDGDRAVVEWNNVDWLEEIE